MPRTAPLPAAPDPVEEAGAAPRGPDAYGDVDAGRFDRWPGVLSRWSLRHALYRARMPVRRRRWDRANRARAAAYLKPEAPPPPGGLALAFGEFSAKTGLGEAARAYLREVRARHPETVAIDLADGRRDGSGGAPATFEGDVGAVYLLCQPEGYAGALARVAPERIAGAHRTGAFVWETPVFPQKWLYALDLVHLLWTPAAFCAAAARSATDLPVEILPYPPAPPGAAAVPALPRARFGVPGDAFLGVAIMDILSCPARKNPHGCAVAWKRAFGDDPSRVLLMKLRMSKRTRLVRREIEALVGRGGNVRLFEAEFGADEITGFQRMADVYLSLHRSEGYGLNIRECLALGAPVVATDWSANAEFGPDYPQYHGVRYGMTPYRDWLNHYPGPRFSWAEPDLDHAAGLLREIAARAG